MSSPSTGESVTRSINLDDYEMPMTIKKVRVEVKKTSSKSPKA